MKVSVSKRVEAVKGSAIRKLIELASKSKDVVHLEQGEPSFPTPEHIVDASIHAMRDGFTHYGPTPGLPELREAIAEKLRRENHLPINGPEEVLVVSGTQEAMFLAALAFLDAGDESLILEPYYPAYFEETLIAEAKPVTVPLSEKDNYQVETENLQRYVSSRTKMIWINSPANPTGHVFSKKDLEAVAEVAQRNNLLVFADEIYEKLVYDGVEHVSIGSLPEMENRVITANGFSKSYAMAGWRIGYVSACRELVDQMSKLHYYAVLCPSTVAQKAAFAALKGPQDCVEKMVKEYDRRRMIVVDALKNIEDLTFVLPRGAFYVFPNVSKVSGNDDNLAEILVKEFGVAMVPGSGFGKLGAGHIRISFSASMTELKKGMDRFQRGIQHLTSGNMHIPYRSHG